MKKCWDELNDGGCSLMDKVKMLKPFPKSCPCLIATLLHLLISFFFLNFSSKDFFSLLFKKIFYILLFFMLCLPHKKSVFSNYQLCSFIRWLQGMSQQSKRAVFI